MRLFRPLASFLPSRPFGPHPRLLPVFLHPGCHRFPPLPIPFLHRFQPSPSPARPLKSTSSRPGSHPSRRHPPVLSSSSELLSLSLAVLPHQSPFAPSCVHPPLPAPRRAHQAPFCARGLLKNIAVSENAPGAHRDVPRAGGCSTDGRWR